PPREVAPERLGARLAALRLRDRCLEPRRRGLEEPPRRAERERLLLAREARPEHLQPRPRLVEPRALLRVPEREREVPLPRLPLGDRVAPVLAVEPRERVARRD